MSKSIGMDGRVRFSEAADHSEEPSSVDLLKTDSSSELKYGGGSWSDLKHNNGSSDNLKLNGSSDLRFGSSSALSYEPSSEINMRDEDIDEERPLLKIDKNLPIEERIRLLEDAANRNAQNWHLLQKDNQRLEKENGRLQRSLSKNETKKQNKTMALIQRFSTKWSNKELRTLSDDVYSFLFCSKLCSVPSWIGMITVFIQIGTFSLFLADIRATHEIPANVEPIVRVGQAGAILITFLAQSDVRTSLRALLYREGLMEIAEEFPGFRIWRYIMGNLLMLTQGSLCALVTVQFVVFTDNMFDLLLNFTAVMFISELDELVFFMARNGYLGAKTEKLAEDIQTLEFGSQNEGGIITGCMHQILFFGMFVAGFIYFGVVIEWQAGNYGLAQYIKVEFGDSVDPTLGLYSGCYEKIGGPRLSSRVVYQQAQTERGQGRFTYCFDDIRSWSFSPLFIPEEEACDNPVLRSAEERPTSFDLLDAMNDQWKLPSGNPIQNFQLVEVDEENIESECGEIFGGTNEELCPILTMEQTFGGFSDDRDWSRSYNRMHADGEPVYFYQHPIYVGDLMDAEEGLELIFFTGRRWLSTTAKGLLTEADADLVIDLRSESDILSLLRDKTDVTNFRLLSLERGAYAFISEAVDQASDRGTPLGLRWYHSRYGESGDTTFPFADISRPADAMFACGKCDSEHNPCLFEGVCREDGTCECKHGATGKLCEVKPLGNGVCNPFFNKASDDYDGGDCCVSTCEGVSCGVGDMAEAFGQQLRRSGNGFPHCVDPQMVPLTITMNHTIDPVFFSGFEDTAGGTFESYFVEVSCNGAEQIPLRVALNPENPQKSSQTLYVADKMDGCKISVLGIQSTSLFNATFQLIDGLPEDAAGGVDVVSTEIRDFSNVTKDTTFLIPTLYAKCLKESLKEVVDMSAYYSGTYQDEALSWMNEELKNGRCTNDKDWRIQRYGLVALWTAGGSPSAVEWGNQNDHCLWSRVNCKDSLPVMLTHNGDTTGRLSGSLASEIGLLTYLERLAIFNNDLNGVLPTELGLLTNIRHLDLSGNNLTGSIPSEIALMPNLGNFHILRGNSFTGTVPSELCNLLIANEATSDLMDSCISGTSVEESNKPPIAPPTLLDPTLVPTFASTTTSPTQLSANVSTPAPTPAVTTPGPTTASPTDGVPAPGRL